MSKIQFNLKNENNDYEEKKINNLKEKIPKYHRNNSERDNIIKHNNNYNNYNLNIEKFNDRIINKENYTRNYSK